MAPPAENNSSSNSRRTKRPSNKQKQKPLAKLLALAVAHATPLALALLVAAVLAPLSLPALERKLDFEESGPLPGSARPNIRSAPGAEARFEAASRAAEHLLDARRGGGGPRAFFAGLARELESRGLEVARLTEWRADWPYGRRRSRRCAALHAVLRSPRGDGKESVAIVTPIALQPRPRSLGGQTRADAALALSAAHALVAGHLRDAAPWLAKDIVWVVVDASCGGAEAVGAWLEAYHQEEQQGRAGGGGGGDDEDDSLLRRRPFVRAGVIQQALVLQSESLSLPMIASPGAKPTAPSPQRPFAASLAVVGADGQLPKTDFYWLVRYYCSKWVRLAGCAPPGFPSSPPNGKSSPKEEDGPLMRVLVAAAQGVGGGSVERARAYASRLALALRFAAQQARGVPTGAHAPFKWRNTDALTTAFSGGGGGGGGAGGGGSNTPGQRARQAAELLELSVRSCSVLVERLHHAFFLYALSSPDHFVSVERYIGPVCALIGVLVLQAAAARRALEGDGDGGDEGRRPAAAAPSSGSWAASARVAVLLPLMCGALGWSLRAGLEAASLAPKEGKGGGGGLLFVLERAAAVGRRLTANGGGGGGSGPVMIDPHPGYAAAEALRLGTAVVALVVLAWIGLAEGGAAVEGVWLLGRRGEGGGRSDGGKTKRAAASSSPDWRMIKVLMLCGAAVPLAGMACSNWALAHACALACAPLAFAAPASRAAAGRSRRGGGGLRIAAVVICSPPGLVVLAFAGMAAVVGPGAGVVAAKGVFGATATTTAADAARWLVLEGTSWTTWLFAWCVYAPLWVASAWIVSLKE
jgi:glycosylphosphatidylinositol transamidase